MARVLVRCPRCARKVVYAGKICTRCDNEIAEIRYRRAKAWHRAHTRLTDEDITAGMGGSLCSAQDYAPAYAELTPTAYAGGHHAVVPNVDSTVDGADGGGVPAVCPGVADGRVAGRTVVV